MDLVADPQREDPVSAVRPRAMGYQFKRLTAQMEVLHEIKRDLRADRPGDAARARAGGWSMGSTVRPRC